MHVEIGLDKYESYKELCMQANNVLQQILSKNRIG